MSVAEKVLETPPDELILADTIGVGNPVRVRELFKSLEPHVKVRPTLNLGAHFHNTRNTGYANAVAAIESGARVLDSSIGGLGGCPFAPNATGNIATEDLVYLLEEMGIQTGINLEELIEISNWLEGCDGPQTSGHGLQGWRISQSSSLKLTTIFAGWIIFVPPPRAPVRICRTQT